METVTLASPAVAPGGRGRDGEHYSDSGVNPITVGLMLGIPIAALVITMVITLLTIYWRHRRRLRSMSSAGDDGSAPDHLVEKADIPVSKTNTVVVMP